MKAVLLLLVLFSVPGLAEDLSWLSGHWANEDTEEVWSEVRDGNLMGYNRTYKDSKITFFEHLRVEKQGNDTVYQACPLGKSWTSFKLSEEAEQEAVFTNPTHDFPQQIHYRRRGDTMEVTISADGHKSVTWTFQLVEN